MPCNTVAPTASTAPTAPTNSDCGPTPVALAAVVVVAAAMAALTLLASPARAEATVDRLAGDGRWETAVEISQDTFDDPDAVDVVYLATGLDFPDALSAGAVASELGGPVLLTVGDELLGVVADELARLDPDEVVLAGGEAVLSDDVAKAVEAETGANARRLAGDATTGRFGTAAQLALDAFGDGADTVFVATGGAFPDALAGGAGAASLNAPLLLAADTELTDPTEQAIDELDPDRAVLLGGTDAVSVEVEQQLRDRVDTVDRLSGAGRWETAVDVSAELFLSAQTVYVATGLEFPDALAGSPAAGLAAGPLLLTPDDRLLDVVAAELRALNPRRVVVLGGPGAVSDDVLDDIAAALAGGTALPGGRLDFAFTNVEPREGESLQTVAIGTTDGGHEVITNPPDGHFDQTLEVSSDGELVAFLRVARDIDDPSVDLHVVDATIGAGSTRSLLTLDDVDDGCVVSEAAWHPDGGRLGAICVPADGDADDDAADPEPRAYLVSVRGGAIAAVPADGGTADEAHVSIGFSPDGDLTLSRVLLDADGFLAPDGAQVVSYDPDDLDAGSTELFVNDEPRQMADPTWSADGSALALLEIQAGSIFGAPDTSVLVVDPSDGSVAARLFATGDGADGPAGHSLGGITADGSQVLVASDADGLAHSILRLMDVAGGDEAVRLVDEGDLDTGDDRDAAIFNADLSPDGSRVIFDDVDEEAAFGPARQFVDGRVVVVDAAGGDLVEQEPVGVNRGLPAWSPNADE